LKKHGELIWHGEANVVIAAKVVGYYIKEKGDAALLE